MWYRVFCRGNEEIKPAKLLARLHENGVVLTGHFKGDDLGWTSAELQIGIGSPLLVERFLTKEDDLRNDLNTWAAFLETLNYSDQNIPLMERMIQTQQLYTIREPINHSNEILVKDACRLVSEILAQSADGVFQIEDDGWYSAEGDLLVKEY
jgi:hypothetical protein